MTGQERKNRKEKETNGIESFGITLRSRPDLPCRDRSAVDHPHRLTIAAQSLWWREGLL